MSDIKAFLFVIGIELSFYLVCEIIEALFEVTI